MSIILLNLNHSFISPVPVPVPDPDILVFHTPNSNRCNITPPHAERPESRSA